MTKGVEEIRTMRPLLLSCCLLGIVAGPSLGSGAARELAPAELDKARALLRRLADRNFKAREKAAAELLRLGPAVRSVLEEGIKDSDAEVRRRCGLLLRLATRTATEIALEDYLFKKDSTGLLKLPSWERFSKFVGADDAAKRLFVE